MRQRTRDGGLFLFLFIAVTPCKPDARRIAGDHDRCVEQFFREVFGVGKRQRFVDLAQFFEEMEQDLDPGSQVEDASDLRSA